MSPLPHRYPHRRGSRLQNLSGSIEDCLAFARQRLMGKTLANVHLMGMLHVGTGKRAVVYWEDEDQPCRRAERPVPGG